MSKAQHQHENSNAVSSKKVKIKALYPICVDGQTVLEKGTEVEVTEEVAKEFCDREFETYYPFYGYAPEAPDPELNKSLQRKKIIRAVRLAG